MFYLEGPMGLGLNLRKYETGSHFIFCENSGELPFLDLLDFIFKKIMLKTLASKYPEEASQMIDPSKFDFEISLENDINFSFYISMNKIENSLTIPLLE